MHMRPRRNEWLPLVTQQMRLRSLMRIEALNVVHNSNGGETHICYTLHAAQDEVAFYTSEPLPLRHAHMKWADINCESMLKSNANCVCIKVWSSTNSTQLSTLSKDLLNVCQLSRPPDKLLFSWGVYFSGLIRLHLNTDKIVHFLPNTLIFLINGNYFGAPDFLMPDSLRDQLSKNYQRIAAYIPNAATIQAATELEETKDSFINSPHVSPDVSPERGNSPTNVTHWQEDLKRMCGQRFPTLNIPAPKVRASYTVKQLLRLQELQRLRQQTLEETQEVMQEIKQVSVLCITAEQLLCKPRRIPNSSSSNNKYQNSMGRTLSDLLAEEEQVDPQVLLRVQKLQMQLETLTARQQLLNTERAAYLERNKQLRLQLAAVQASRTQINDWLESKRAALKLEQEQLVTQKEVVGTQHQLHCSIMQQLEQRMSALCLELREIYPIIAKNGFYTICNIAMPNLDAYMNDAKYASNIGAEHITPMALSAALGYLAHLVQIISIIINRPLRNPIIQEGSRSRIMDIVKDLPVSSREFPLYCRSVIPSKAVKYGIYLLNQNIAQHCFDISGVRCNLSATIDNIKRIFATFAEYEESQRLLFDHVDSAVNKTNLSCMRIPLHRNKNFRKSSENNAIVKHNTKDGACDEILSKSHSSVAINYMPLQTTTTAIGAETNSLELTIADLQLDPQLSQRRVCRSVGSYSDCEDEHLTENNERTFANSDSDLICSRRDKRPSLSTFKMPE